jgi:hypothetical protein
VGRVAFVISFETSDAEGEHVSAVKVDIGGGENLTPSHFSAPGVDARPLPGDYVATSSHPGDNEESAVGYADPDNAPVAGDGEVRLYARDSSGAPVAIVHCKADGSIEIAGSGTVTINGNFEVDP